MAGETSATSRRTRSTTTPRRLRPPRDEDPAPARASRPGRGRRAGRVGRRPRAGRRRDRAGRVPRNRHVGGATHARVGRHSWRGSFMRTRKVRRSDRPRRVTRYRTTQPCPRRQPQAEARAPRPVLMRSSPSNAHRHCATLRLSADRCSIETPSERRFTVGRRVSTARIICRTYGAIVLVGSNH